MTKNKGFTLVELLVVIAIISILSIIVILYINPAELLRQARDSNRLSDLNALKHAITLYLNEENASVSMGSAGVCYIGNSIGTSTAGCQSYFATATSVVTSISRALDGTGWVPVNFSQMSTGVPLDKLPIDPLGPDNPNYFYSYITNPATAKFKLAAKIESNLYGLGGDRDVVSADNGVSSSTFESGSDTSL